MRLRLPVLWTVARELDSAREFSFFRGPRSAPLQAQLGITTESGTLCAFNSGASMVTEWESLMQRLNRTLLEVSGANGTAHEWGVHYGEVRRVARRFFFPASHSPCFLWASRICWTDGCSVQLGYDADFDRRLDPHGMADYQWHDVVRFSYDHPSGPNGWHAVHVKPSRLLWHGPDGMVPKRTGFVKFRERRKSVLPSGRRSISYRDQLGVGQAMSCDCQPFLQRGLHPGLDGLIHALLSTGEQDGLLLVPSRVEKQGVKLGKPKRPGHAVLDPCGILDLETIKLWRLWLWRGDEGECEPYVDELTFAQHRRTGRMVYISASRDKFAYAEPEEGNPGWLWPWLREDYGVG
jgi:hypothetical protein